MIENINNKEEEQKQINNDIYGRKTETLTPNIVATSHNNCKELSLSTRSSDVSRNTLPIKSTIINFNFKLVLVGNVCVGKSSIIKRYINNTYSEEYISTIGTDLSKKAISIGGNKNINLFIWDTCGQEKFRSVTKQYFIDAQSILLVFDLTDIKSFNDLNSWIKEAENYINDDCIFFLFGNKSDENDKRQVSSIEIKKLMKKHQKIKKYFEVSALNGDEIEISFDKICNFLVIQYEGDEIKKEYHKRKLSSHNKNINENRCC